MDTSRFLDITSRSWRRVYHFAYRLLRSHDKAESIVMETYLRIFLEQDMLARTDPEKLDEWLLHMAVLTTQKQLGSGALMTLQSLDDILRSDPSQVTRTHDLSENETNGLLWELKQTCMTAVLSGLSTGERFAFVLATHLGYSPDQASTILGITPAAYKVRLSRAQKKVADYLAPRCQHVDSKNPCRCRSRLGVALSKGFIRPVEEMRKVLQSLAPEPFDSASVIRDVITIYETLPFPLTDQDLHQVIAEAVLSGRWEALRHESVSGESR